MTQADSYIPKYHQPEHAEIIAGYQPGGYHPVHIDDEFAEGRYSIKDKLGYGTYSTVWLAADKPTGEYVALKFSTARSSQKTREFEILKHMKEIFQRETPQRPFLPLLDYFEVKSPNGHHLVIVSAVNAVELSIVIEATWGRALPNDQARAIAAQLILGLDKIHSCEVAHGDLYPSNILCRTPIVDGQPDHEMKIRREAPLTEDIKRCDGQPLEVGVPRYVVFPNCVRATHWQRLIPEIVIGDFGEAWIVKDAKREDLNTPAQYLPPEATFAKESIGFPADIWTLGCTIFELYNQGPLLESGLGLTQDTAIRAMMESLGPLPQAWWDKWETKDQHFPEGDETLADIFELGYQSDMGDIRERIQEVDRTDGSHLSDEEADLLADMLGAMLRYEPAQRPNTEQLIAGPWMQEYGLPSLEKIGTFLEPA